MCTEPTEQKLSAVFVGVSSWGFGGTNAQDQATKPRALERVFCSNYEAQTCQGPHALLRRRGRGVPGFCWLGREVPVSHSSCPQEIRLPPEPTPQELRPRHAPHALPVVGIPKPHKLVSFGTGAAEIPWRCNSQNDVTWWGRHVLASSLHLI